MAASRLLMDTASAALAKAASATLLRQRAIITNVVNAQTPGYQPLRVEFEAALEAAIRREKSDAGFGRGEDAGAGIDGAITLVRREIAPPHRWDQNGVNLEEEVVALAEATIQHEAVIRLLSGKFRMLEIVLSSRG